MERSTVMKTIAGGGLSSPPCFYFPRKTAAGGASLSSCRKPEPDNQANDSEICLFDAQKYFNDSGSETKISKRVSPVNNGSNAVNLEHASERYDFSYIPRFSSASSSVDGYSRNYSAHSFHRVPTALSEASWNSQAGLLPNPPGAIAGSTRNPPRRDDRKKGSASKWLFRGKCPCSGKKSVQVVENLSVGKCPDRGKKSVQVEESLSKGKCPCTGKKSVEVESLSEFRTTSLSGLNSKVSLNLKNQIPNQVANAVEDGLVIPTNRLDQKQGAIPIINRISADNNSSASSIGQYHVCAGRPFSDPTNGFTFPILSQTPSQMKVVLNGLPSTNQKPPIEDPPRDSLEIFQLANDPIPGKSMNDHHRRHSFIATDDDMISEASSDLFEIESFSTLTTSYPTCDIINRSDAHDKASGFSTRSPGAANGRGLHSWESLDDGRTPPIAPTECYEPSEVSFDWSVATAEGFDRESITNDLSCTASEADEKNNLRHHETAKHSGSTGGGKWKAGNGRLLLSCRCEKAVSVGPHPVKNVCQPRDKELQAPHRGM